MANLIPPGPIPPSTADWQNPQQVPWHRWDAVPRTKLAIWPPGVVSETVIASGNTIYSPGSIMGQRADGAYVLATKAATDGSQNPRAVLADYVDATQGDVRAGVYMAGQFNSNALSFDSGFTIDELTTALRPLGIYLQAC